MASNPFPGLRPFEPDEDHLFFGRERQIDELLRRLRTNRFLSVVGGSGCGKSSLIRSGLIPSLFSGFMAGAGSAWRIALLKPGDDPIGALASALDAGDVLGHSGELAETSRVLLEATLRRSTLGLVEAVRQARIPAHENVLVVVDQFEELFRFRRGRELCEGRDEGVAFVRLLLEAAAQSEAPVYVVITMRSDFIGDCAEYPGLPEAINAGQYLVPRMQRDAIRSAITGPIAVAGGEISPRLVFRLLNDVGDDPDQLPLLQHALMRTWNYWEQRHADGAPLDLIDYEAIGTLRNALSMHAEEAYAEVSQTKLVELLFKALTDTVSDSRGTRRPTSVSELAAICDVSEADIAALVETFRRPGQSFLTPPSSVALNSRSIIDISHESLMRCWTRLVTWTEEERVSAEQYLRTARAAACYQEGTGGLWRDPELELGLQWRRGGNPTAAWAARYDPSFERAMSFLDHSERERNSQIAESDRRRKQKLRNAWTAVAVLGVLVGVVAVLAILAQRAEDRAERNFTMAHKAVDEMLLSAGAETAREAADVPQVEEFRRRLLDKAKLFYIDFTKEKPGHEGIMNNMGAAHFHLGDIDRLLQQPSEALREYSAAIDLFRTLLQKRPTNEGYKESLADAYHWRGETYRTLPAHQTQAADDYNSAIDLREDLHKRFSENAEYAQKLARTHYSRGIVRASAGKLEDADRDYSAAIDLLTALTKKAGLPDTFLAECREALGRTYNYRAMVLETEGKLDAADLSFQKAIRIHRELVRAAPDNHDENLELAKFLGNLAGLYIKENKLDDANRVRQQSETLLADMAEPVPSVTAQIAHSHTSHGLLLQSRGSQAEAEREFGQAIELLTKLEDGREADDRDYHLFFGEALFRLGMLQRGKHNLSTAAPLFAKAASQHAAAHEQAQAGLDNYWLARTYLDAGDRAKAGDMVKELSALSANSSEPARSELMQAHSDLLRRLDKSQK
jgi:hypothetical protein